MKLKVSEVLVLANLLAYGILRFSVDIGGFNWWGLYRVLSGFSYAVVWLLPLAYVLFLRAILRDGAKDMSFRKLLPLRELAVVLLLFFSYWSLAGVSGGDKIDLIHFVTKEDKGWLLIKMDELLLGFQPSQKLQYFSNPAVSLFLLIIYTLAYLPLLFLLIFALHILGESKEKELFVTGIIVAYTISIPIFFLIPAPTPQFVLEYSPDHNLYDGEWGKDLDNITNDLDSTQRNSFPSLHVALSTLAIIYSRRLLKWQRAAIIALASTMWFATLYLRYHYFIDLPGGWAVALFSAWASPRLIAKWSKWVG